MRTIAVINQKGGVGKTTTVANLGSRIAARGRRVCLIDLDPQAHLTLHLGVEPGEGGLGIYDVLTSERQVSDVVVEVSPTLWLIPSTIDLAAAAVELTSAVGRESILREKMSKVQQHFDYVLIDCPPSLGLLTLNALSAADDVFIPLQPHFLALQGLGKLLETVEIVQREINPSLKVSGIIFCMYETATRLAGEVVMDLRKFIQASRGTDKPWADARIFPRVIRRNIKLAECPSYGQTIFQYDTSSNGAKDYEVLTDQFFAMFDGQEGAG